MASYWKFRDFLSSSGRNVIDEWYKDLPAAGRAEFDALLSALAVLPRWGMPEFRVLTGSKKYAHLSELRFKSANVQHRVPGFVGVREYTMLIGCTHKQQVYSPTNALDTAATRRRQVLSGERETCEHEI